MATCLVIFLVACVSSLLITRWVRDWAGSRGLLDRPDDVRKLHQRAVPRIGGLALFLALVLSIGVAMLLPTAAGEYLRSHLLRAAMLLGLGALMMLVGLWDDLRNLKPWVKFAAQVAMALLSWSVGLRILGGWSPHGGVFHLGALSIPLTILWIVLITNAFNLIDGVDGLSAGAALLATLSMLVVSIANNQPLSAALLAALAGATLGFLRHNFNPASIFLGDSGSLLLGFTLAILSLESYQKSPMAFSIALPIVAFGLPVLDTALVVLRRFLNGRPLFGADRRHIHHVLMDRGIKPRQVVILLYAVCGLFGLFSLMFLNPSGRNMGFALAILGACLWFGIQQMHYPELRELNNYVVRGIQHQRRLITGNVRVGRMLDGFHSARKLSEVLDSLSELLDETEFTCAEVRLPALHNNRLVLRAKDWTAVCEGRTHCLYRWSHPTAVAPGQFEHRGLGRDFRLEFVFAVPRAAAGDEMPGRKDTPSSDMGRLTFFHRADTEFPFSAVCLLSRNIWRECSEAICRVMALPHAGHADECADQPAEGSHPAWNSLSA